jgi:hypothetical protein
VVKTKLKKLCPESPVNKSAICGSQNISDIRSSINKNLGSRTSFITFDFGRPPIIFKCGKYDHTSSNALWRWNLSFRTQCKIPMKLVVNNAERCLMKFLRNVLFLDSAGP